MVNKKSNNGAGATGKELVKSPEQLWFDRRDKLMPAVYNMCDIFGAPYPLKNSHTERILVDLAPHWLELQKRTAKEMIDGALLPPLVLKTIDANIPREKLWREKLRHASSMVFGGASSSIFGAFWSVIEAFVENLVLAMEKLAIVIVPFVFGFFGYLLVSLMKQPGRWTPPMIGEVLLPSFLFGLGMAVLAATIYSMVRTYQRSKEKGDIVLTEKWGDTPVE